jgi:DNA-binding protein Fis
VIEDDDDEIVPLTLEEVEEVHILDTMRRCRDNQARAARELGIGRNTLWRKLKRIQAKMAKPDKA